MLTRLTAWVLLLTMATALAACVVEEPGPGPDHDRWCYNHPGRCR
jgi:hypothetical protein